MESPKDQSTGQDDAEPREAAQQTHRQRGEAPRLGVASVAPFLFFSGMCALVYQVAWLGELRLIFGASTAASAAVLAVFMAGLGVGGLLLGKRADRAGRPPAPAAKRSQASRAEAALPRARDGNGALGLYANLELAVAASTALTPLLVTGSRKLYIALGGSSVLGLTGATVVRLLLAAVILGVPTFLMGGTLPAAAKAVARAADAKRRDVGTLYAVNTLGAVTGAFAANFLLLEVFGTRVTLWLACLINALVGMFARSMARRPAPASAVTSSLPAAGSGAVLPQRLLWFPPAAAAVAGFAFLLMELVWYRMLGPILGGSSYSFGLILCVALLGIGIGGAIYAAVGQNRPATLVAFAFTCALEALFVMIPLAAGDAVAVGTIALRVFGAFGFAGHVATWTIVTCFVVLPAAVVSGYQFPLIIALFGKADTGLGKHVGLAYASNTVGSIAGSLAGGFGLIPLLSAPGCWKAVGALLAASALATAAIAIVHEQRRIAAVAAGAVGLAAASLLLSRGPTATWRHGAIGAGRSAAIDANTTRNEITEALRARRRWFAWEADGVESSVALNARNAYAFLVNGKSDGNAVSDAGTQVMGGLIGAAVVPEVRDAFIVGLGTGSTAGWLGRLPELERIDVAELEPLILRVARDCGPVNHNVLDNPKVHVTIGDARELLLTSRRTYDLIFSEPSNPYRAGIASLYTQEFYAAASSVLREDGVFLQWLQIYDVDGEAVHTALATLASVFPFVSVWQSQPGDLILMATRHAQRIDTDALRARLKTEPFRHAMLVAWRMQGAEGFLAHHMANPAFARRVAERQGDNLNTDDTNLLEYSFARTVGRGKMVDNTAVFRVARSLGLDRPEPVPADIDWTRVDVARASDVGPLDPAFLETAFPPEAQRLYRDMLRYSNSDFAGLRKSFQEGSLGTLPLGTVAMYAEAFSTAGMDEALPLIEGLRKVSPGDAAILEAQMAFARNLPAQASERLRFAFGLQRTDPWGWLTINGLRLAPAIAAKDKTLAPALLDSLNQPFTVFNLEEERHLARLRIALKAGRDEQCADYFRPFEPNAIWQQWFLERRLGCYRKSGHALAAAAEADVVAFLARAPIPVGDGLIEDTGAPLPEGDGVPPAASARP